MYVEEKGISRNITEEGRYYDVSADSKYDLFLADVEWSNTPKKDDIVWVKQTKHSKWEKRQFLTDLGDGIMNRYICRQAKADKFHYGWSYMTTEAPLNKPEITIKVNGKEVKLSDTGTDIIYKIFLNEQLG